MRTKWIDIIEDCSAKPWHNAEGHKQSHRNKKGKYKIGPGGLNCPCCTSNFPANFKAKCNRLERRKAKQDLHNLTS